MAGYPQTGDGATGRRAERSSAPAGRRPTPAGRAARLGMLLGVALALYAVESALPSPFPFVRVGLANIATIVALLMLGLGDALAVTVLRVLIASLVAGTFLGPAFAMAMSGGVAAALTMGFAVRFAFPPLGVVGIGVAGAVAHNLAQLVVLAGLYTGPEPAMRLVPAALLIAAATGAGTGLVVLFVLEKLGPIGR